MKRVFNSHKMKNTHIYIVYILILIFGCNGSSDSDLDFLLSIDVPKRLDDNIQLSALSDSVYVIKLETNEGAFITNVNDVFIFKEDLVIVTLDGRVLIFGPKGEFKQVLGKKGEGPGEYKYVSSFSIDEELDLLYIVSSRKVLVYSSEFEFLKEYNLNFFIDYITLINGGLYAVSQEYGNVVEEGYANETILYSLSSDFEIIDTLPLRKVVMKKKVASVLGYKHFLGTNGIHSFIYAPVTTNEEILRDTLYQLEGNQILPYAKLNFPKPHHDEKGIKQYWIANIVNASNFLFTYYFKKDNPLIIFLYDKRTEKGYNTVGFLDNEGDPVFLRPLDLANDIFYYVKKVEYVDKSTEEENPMIGIVKLK